MSKPNTGSGGNKIAFIVVAVVAVVLLGVVLFSRQSGNATSGAVANFDISNHPVLGQTSAPVTLVVFEDFKCPNCKNFDENIMPDIKSKYIDTGKAKLVAMSYPFLAQSAGLPTDDSTLAAVAAKCVAKQGNNQYWSYSTLLFRGQGSEQTVWATQEALTDLAGSVDGLNMDTFSSCLKNQDTLAQVNADKDAGTRAGVQGTPSVFVNGKLMSDYSAATVGAAIEAAAK